MPCAVPRRLFACEMLFWTHECLTWLAVWPNRFLCLFFPPFLQFALVTCQRETNLLLPLVVLMSSCACLMYYSCFRTMILDLTALISSLRDVWTRTFLVPFWHSVSALSSSRNVLQCPSSLAINGCASLSCTPVNLTHGVLLPRETQVDHHPRRT